MSNKSLSYFVDKIESGQRPKGGVNGVGDIPSLGAEHLNDFGGFYFKNQKMISLDFYNSMTNGKIETKDILIVKDGATTGKVSYVDEEFPFKKAAINEHLFKLKIDKTKAIPKYIFHFLHSEKGKREILTDFRGATVGGIARTFLDKVNIPTFDLIKQTSIVALLDKADSIRKKRKETIKLADEFLRSTFLEMFGDPYLNSMEWKKEICENLFEMKLGKMLSAKNYTGKDLKPYLRNVNVQWGKIVIDDVKEMDFDEREFSIYKLEKGDILVCEGGEVGKTAIFNGEIENCGFQNALHRLRIKDFGIINREYFLFFMIIAVKSGVLKKETISVTIAHFTLEKFRKFKIPLPPIELQNKFAEIVEKTEKLKAKYQQSLEESENLFNSLMQRAFKGEL